MLFNRSKGNRVISKVKFADGFFGKFRGLMLEKEQNFDYALVFDFGNEKKTGASIHMMFVFFPIDAVYLDAEKKVVDVAKGLKPFALNYTPKEKAAFLIELPEGYAKGIWVGDRLEWEKQD